MEALLTIILISIFIPTGAVGLREILRIPRKWIGLPLAPEVLGNSAPNWWQNQYWKLMDWVGMNLELQREIASAGSLKPGEGVLDLGSGTGELTLYLKTIVGDKGEVAGIEINENFLYRSKKRARNYGIEVSFCQGNAVELPFDDNSFDVITCSLVAHHLSTPDKNQMFSEANRVLKPGGRILFFDLAQPQSLAEHIRVWILLSIDLLFEWHCASANLNGELPRMITSAHLVIKKQKFGYMQGIRTQLVVAKKLGSGNITKPNFVDETSNR